MARRIAVKRVLDTNILINLWHGRYRAFSKVDSLRSAEKTAKAWLKREPDDGILTPIRLEFLAGIRDKDESESRGCVLVLFPSPGSRPDSAGGLERSRKACSARFRRTEPRAERSIAYFWRFASDSTSSFQVKKRSCLDSKPSSPSRRKSRAASRSYPRISQPSTTITG